MSGNCLSQEYLRATIKVSIFINKHSASGRYQMVQIYLRLQTEEIDSILTYLYREKFVRMILMVEQRATLHGYHGQRTIKSLRHFNRPCSHF
jgi:uncharacterized protein YlbG (UPF0298 family)